MEPRNDAVTLETGTHERLVLAAWFITSFEHIKRFFKPNLCIIICFLVTESERQIVFGFLPKYGVTSRSL